MPFKEGLLQSGIELRLGLQARLERLILEDKHLWRLERQDAKRKMQDFARLKAMLEQIDWTSTTDK